MVSGWTTPGKGQSAWREQKISTNYGARLRMMFTLEDLPLSLFGAVAFSKEYGVTADSSVILGDQKVSLSAPRAVDILSGLFGLHVFKNFPILLRAKADNRLYTLAAFERDDLGEVKSGALQHQDKRIGADLYYTRLVRAPSVNWFGVGARFLRQRLLAQIDESIAVHHVPATFTSGGLGVGVSGFHSFGRIFVIGGSAELELLAAGALSWRNASGLAFSAARTSIDGSLGLEWRRRWWHFSFRVGGMFDASPIVWLRGGQQAGDASPGDGVISGGGRLSQIYFEGNVRFKISLR